MRYWLMKSEPDEVSIDDLAAAGDKGVPWFGVRNYQARNFMMRDMAVGDLVLFYHSSVAEPGIAGIGQVCSPAYPDETQFDESAKYFDAKASREKPRWYNVDVAFVSKGRYVSLKELRADERLAGMVLLQRGSRLSITPVTGEEWEIILREKLETPDPRENF